jgi:phospholipid transport system substrate-binding protein
MISISPTTKTTSTFRTPPGSRRIAAACTLAALLAAMPLAAPPAAASQETSEARAVVDEAVEAVLAVLREPNLSTEQRRSRIEEIAYDRFDFETISRLVLARGWRQFSEEQRSEFVEQFKRHLSASYGSRVERYDQESVGVVGERLEPRGDVTIQTRIRGGQFDGTAVDYRLREREGTWKVIDVVIEGVSLASNFRSQFAELLSRGGPEEVLRRLRDRTLPLEDG